MRLLLIAIGGALGSVTRYLLGTAVMRATGSPFPAGTFAVNLVGCALFGMIVGAGERRVQLTPDLRAFLLVGVLGGFTTFSSYAFESLGLLQDGHFPAAAFNIVGQVVAGLLGLWLGYVVAS